MHFGSSHVKDNLLSLYIIYSVFTDPWCLHSRSIQEHSHAYQGFWRYKDTVAFMKFMVRWWNHIRKHIIRSVSLWSARLHGATAFGTIELILQEMARCLAQELEIDVSAQSSPLLCRDTFQSPQWVPETMDSIKHYMLSFFLYHTQVYQSLIYTLGSFTDGRFVLTIDLSNLSIQLFFLSITFTFSLTTSAYNYFS